MTKKYYATATVVLEKRTGMWVEEDDEEAIKETIAEDVHGEVSEVSEIEIEDTHEY